MDLLKFANNRLNKFYNPKLYKAPPERELSEENSPKRIKSLSAWVELLHPQLPLVALQNWDRFGPGSSSSSSCSQPCIQTKGDDSSGVIQMIHNLVNDVEKENQVMKLEEGDNQDDYEKIIGDAKDKHATDSKSMTDAEGSLA